MLSLIAAMANNRVIGKNKKLPWHLPNDLKFFKEVTLGKPIIMGRKTHEAIGRALPERRNIVITSDPNLQFDGCEMVHSFQQAYELAQGAGEIMVIGGANVYEQALLLAEKLYITFVDADIDGDAFFPEINWNEWREVSRVSHKKDAQHEYDYAFVVFVRK